MRKWEGKEGWGEVPFTPPTEPSLREFGGRTDLACGYLFLTHTLSLTHHPRWKKRVLCRGSWGDPQSHSALEPVLHPHHPPAVWWCVVWKWGQEKMQAYYWALP
eukprot:Sspe_Gene.102207::Locus_77056_Transcript_1_1_Confidence_1.000_Length_560::g.102207::m.102207